MCIWSVWLILPVHDDSRYLLAHSYGGMLTAWMRFKYPNLVDGGLAGSAPIYYTEGLVSRTAFFAKVTNVSVFNGVSDVVKSYAVYVNSFLHVGL